MDGFSDQIKNLIYDPFGGASSFKVYQHALTKASIEAPEAVRENSSRDLLTLSEEFVNRYKHTGHVDQTGEGINSIVESFKQMSASAGDTGANDAGNKKPDEKNRMEDQVPDHQKKPQEKEVIETKWQAMAAPGQRLKKGDLIGYLHQETKKVQVPQQADDKGQQSMKQTTMGTSLQQTARGMKNSGRTTPANDAQMDGSYKQQQNYDQLISQEKDRKVEDTGTNVAGKMPGNSLMVAEHAMDVKYVSQSGSISNTQGLDSASRGKGAAVDLVSYDFPQDNNNEPYNQIKQEELSEHQNRTEKAGAIRTHIKNQ